MDRYLNRVEAGQVLAEHLKNYSHKTDVIVLALPRGGVPVAFEISSALHAPLDVFIVRKLGVPGHEELAMGAIAMGNVTIFNDDIVRDLQISKEAISRVIAEEEAELNRRTLKYRGPRPFPTLKNKKVILVDDGIATGATMRAAIKALRKLEPAKLIVAVPVAAADICQKMEIEVDEFVCPMCPTSFYAVGTWYQEFDQTSDEEVKRLLEVK